MDLAERTSFPGTKALAIQHVALTGNPNSGKTTLFNALTGLRAKVGNYAGVTVERKEGRLLGGSRENPVTVIDLPGTYSLSPQSLDEQISRDVLFHRLADVPAPDAIVVVVDASNLQRNLYYATQVIELGYPTILALNMIDVARNNGHEIDAEKLSRKLGVPVVPVVASERKGISELTTEILKAVPPRAPESVCEMPRPIGEEAEVLAESLEKVFPENHYQAKAEALLLLTDEKFFTTSAARYPESIRSAVATGRERITAAGIDWRSAVIEARYASISEIQHAVTTETILEGETFSDKLDRVLTHRIWGVLIFLVIMTAMFQSIFTFAQIPMDLLGKAVDWFGNLVGGMLSPGPLNDLLVKGMIKGVGAVVIFLPQICLLFLFIGLLEDTGYMSRAAFLMDRLMSKVGLHGKSFIPMLSSFACAIPGIMATRTIESAKDRLVTILVAPLMSCSARLPVYTVLIAACIPRKTYFGILKLPGLTLLIMYLLGIVVALFMAWLFKKTLLKGPTPILIMELPPYKRPLLRTVVRHMWDRSKMFLRRAGTVILAINILLWFLATYPKSTELEKQYEARRAALKADTAPASPEKPEALEAQINALDKEEAGEKLRGSFAGRLGRLIEPTIRPLGFDWKIGVGIVASFAAREVFVSTMSLVYNVGDYERSEASTSSLAQTMKRQVRPDGTPVYTTLVAVTLMIFYVFALQCVSTVAIVRRETNSWKWPLFQWLYMGALAWALAFLVYQGGRALGFG
ncbi:MAG TPA: ferrous iron transport protein B [Candidatus Saccharimonadales bacterium]|nr:ferrous iron transport protein B [Candidatus Saccharimonadales bacterium]